MSPMTTVGSKSRIGSANNRNSTSFFLQAPGGSAPALLAHYPYPNPVPGGQDQISLYFELTRNATEVRVEVYAEDPLNNRSRHASSAILTYVALDNDGKPIRVPRLTISGEEEQRRFKEGEERHLRRKT